MQHQPLRRRVLALLGSAAILAALIVPAGSAAASSGKGPLRFTRHIDALRAAAPTASGTTADGPDSVFAEWLRTHQIDAQEPRGGGAVVSGAVAAPSSSATVSVGGSTPGLTAAWEGSNHFDSRYSGGGYQFSGEPPDQGLCASNSRVFEIVNSVVQVYDTSGNALIGGTPYFPGTGPVGLTLNEFFGQAPEFVRPSGPFGPFSFDVVCKYDPSVSRWFVTAEFLAQDPTTGDFAGPGGVYLAVSTSSDPLAGWNVWTLDTTNNGTNGTPDHQCSGGFCFGDFPHFGLDGSGLYLTTDEFDLFGNGEFHGAQLYAFSKADLVAGDADATMVYMPNVASPTVDGGLAYAMLPADGLPADRDARRGGTEYFAMTQSPFLVGNATAVSLYRLTNTSSLSTDAPSLTLSEAITSTEPYSAPGYALQQAGDTPLLDCANHYTCIGATYPHQQGPLPIDSGTGGMAFGAWLRRGIVYVTTGTNLAGPGEAFFNHQTGKWKATNVHAGVAYFALRPSRTGPYSVSRVFQGYVDLPGENLIYPSLVMDANGNGAIGVTLVGPDYHPTAAYLRFGTSGPAGGLAVSGVGMGANDGFSGTGVGGFDPRWGDYPAAAVAPNGTIWLANEYINQSCGDAEFAVDTTCGYTRTFYANWSTHITGLHF